MSRLFKEIIDRRHRQNTHQPNDSTNEDQEKRINSPPGTGGFLLLLGSIVGIEIVILICITLEILLVLASIGSIVLCIATR